MRRVEDKMTTQTNNTEYKDLTKSEQYLFNAIDSIILKIMENSQKRIIQALYNKYFKESK